MTEPTEDPNALKIGTPWIPQVSPEAVPVRGFLDQAYSGFTRQSAEPVQVAANDDLSHDSSVDDRTDMALRARSDAYSQADALNWLLEGSSGEAGATPKTPEPVKEADKPQASFLQTAATGFAESPRQAVGGVRDAVQSMLDLGTWAETHFELGGVQITDEQGNFAPAILSGPELKAARKKGVKTPELPDVGQPQTGAGSIVRAVTHFLAPFGLASKTIGGLKAATTLGSVVKAATAGAFTDFLAFVGDAGNVSDLVQAVPALENPITEFLASDKDDSEITGRLKNAIEGLGIGIMAEGLFRGVKAYKSWSKIAKEKDPGKVAAETMQTATDQQVMRDAGDLRLLGSTNETVPLVIGDKITSKLKAGMKETEAGVPDDVVAKALTSRGLTQLEGTDGVYINFARINEPKDIQRIIKDTSSAFKEDIDKARRGVRTNSETKLSADKVDAWSTLVARRSGEPLNAEQSVAARQLWATSADKLGQVAKIAADLPTPENLFQFRRMLATHHAIQKEVIAARSETARALQSWRIPVGGNIERMAEITSALDRSGGAEVAASMAQRIAVLAKGPNAASALGYFAEKSIGAKTLGVVQEYWINAILSGPKTHMVNAMSNAGVMGISVIERSIAARYGRLFSDEAGVEVGEAMAQIQGIRGGIWDAFRNAGKTLRTGQTGFGMNKIEMPRERYISSGAWDVRSDSWLGRGIDGIGSIVNVPGRSLQVSDEFFKTNGYRMELHAQAQRMASQELRAGKIGKDQMKTRVAEILDNPPEAIRLESSGMAAYQTFTSEPGKLTRGIQRLIGDFPVAKFILPFTNTPSNILKYTFERTPLAPLTAKYRNAIARGGADADLARTKLALGTMTMMIGMDLALNGYTTGSGPSGGSAQMQNWRRQGNAPYSLRLGDKNITFSRMDPMGYHLGISADIAEYVMNAEADEATAAEMEEMFAASVFAVAEGATSKSYMQGMALLTEAIEDPDRFGAAYLEKFASSFIPTGVGEVARFVDPVQRATHDLTSSFKRKLPGFSDELPARRDLWGKEISYQSGFGRTYDAISPLYGTTYKPEPIDLAMEKDGWFLGMGGQGVAINGETVSFRNRPDIKNRYYELRGATKPSDMGADWLEDRYGDASMLDTMNGMVTGKNDLAEAWDNASSPEDREKLARGVFMDYGRAAREKVMAEYPWIGETAVRQAKAREILLAPEAQ